MRVCVRSLFLLESPTAGIAPPPALPRWDVSQLAALGLGSKTQCLPALPHTCGMATRPVACSKTRSEEHSCCFRGPGSWLP